MIIKWMKRLKWMRISKYAIIICLLLSLVFAGFTVYGANTGNFNIYVQATDVNLALYMDEDRDLQTRLSIPTLERMEDMTYSDLYVPNTYNALTTGLGCKNDEEHKMYLAFTFCLVNLSERAVDFDMELTVTETRDGIGGGEIMNAMRVLVFEDEDLAGGTIYAKPETDPDSETNLALNTNYSTEDFFSYVQVFNQTYYGMETNEEIKFTFVLWLEGWDNDCIDDIYGSKIKMRLDFYGR